MIIYGAAQDFDDVTLWCWSNMTTIIDTFDQFDKDYISDDQIGLNIVTIIQFIKFLVINSVEFS